MAKDQKHGETLYRYNSDTKNNEFVTQSSPNAVEPEVWQYKDAKGGGANEAGELGGVYQSLNRTALFKQDPNPAKNIAEFLASQMHRSTHPEHQAEVFFAKVTDEAGKPTHPYIASIFFNNYQGDLFKYAYTSKGLIPPEDRPKFMGTQNVLVNTFGIENTAALINEILSSLPGFAESVVPRLLTNDMDMHSGNLGVEVENGMGKFVSIDFGGANASLEEKIHPHSHTRHIPGLGPTNHFREYGRKYKITPAFAAECDKVAKHDYTKTIDDAFEKIAEYNNFKAIKAFGNLLGMPTKQLRIPDTEINKEKLLGIIKEHYKVIIKARQEDLSKFSAQIKTDLCLKSYKENGELSYENVEGEDVTLKQVIKEHKGYFEAILGANEKLKFRDNDNSKNYKALKETVLSTAEETLGIERKTNIADILTKTFDSANNKVREVLSSIKFILFPPRDYPKQEGMFIDNNLSFSDNPVYKPKPAQNVEQPKINSAQQSTYQSQETYPPLTAQKIETSKKVTDKSIKSNLSTSPFMIKSNNSSPLATTELTTDPKAFENNQPLKIEGLKDIISKVWNKIKSFTQIIKEKFISENDDSKGR
ncbi:hypothetical protein NF27_JF00380 [Candidatus Jidaibacter acanthamoeba]|uniref:LepB N-terminal domain-containing protein n=1 Tax=Candidatus Jidaibacter acanthamoebae TaxID=86105 RepID=A0A0C1QVY0_9RICK|nr:hypothetical protein [Candidatus Jidaibacter acanthamoeba]KIE04160.1 hypothetical protein NF27_JF00380 [Candidatus Jidaibacter acanthamoeba]